MAAIPTLLIVAEVYLAAATMFTYIGDAVTSKERGLPRSLPQHAFAAFWYAFAAEAVLMAGQLILASIGAADMALYRLLYVAQALFGGFGLIALGYFVHHLWAGRTVDWRPWVVGGSVVAAMGLAVFVMWPPQAVRVSAWDVALVTQMPVLTDTMHRVLMLAPRFVLPVIFLALLPKAAEGVARDRLLSVSVSLLMWQIAWSITSFPSALTTGAFVIVGAFHVGAAVFALNAYTPSWLETRPVIHTIDSTKVGDGGDATRSSRWPGVSVFQKLKPPTL